MEKSELDALKCRNIVQCKNHPKVKGMAVNLFEADDLEDRNTQCGCKVKDFQVVGFACSDCHGEGKFEQGIGESDSPGSTVYCQKCEGKGELTSSR